MLRMLLCALGGRERVVWMLLAIVWCTPSRFDATPRPRVSYRVPEELEAGHEIGDCGRDANLAAFYGLQVASKFVFSLLPASIGVLAGKLAVSSSGVLSTLMPLDREKLCSWDTLNCSLRFDVAARPNPIDFLIIIQVTLLIEDVNDHTPRFPRPSMTISVSETANPGVSFVVPSAEDADVGKNAVRRYQMTSHSDVFELNVSNGTDNGLEVRLVLKRKLDREKVRDLTLQIRAEDDGSPRNFGLLTVRIHVADANDNSPQFPLRPYNVLVREDGVVPRRLLVVNAEDNDIGRNGEVEYRWTSRTKEHFGRIFSIGRSTGEIYLLEELDFERRQKYTLELVATDRGDNPIPAYAKVTVNVVDVNDHAPVITVNSMSGGRKDVTLKENSPLGTFVAHVSVVDEDSGERGHVTCMLNSSKFRLESVFQNEYNLQSADTFDRERTTSVGLRITCSDEARENRRTEHRDLAIAIGDRNDHKPRCSGRPYNVHVQENGGANALLLRVNALDADADDNGAVRYALAAEPSAPIRLAVHETTGDVRALQNVDFERLPRFEFAVVATDQGAQSRSTTCSVFVVVSDVNDEPPSFLHARYTFSVTENRDAGAYVGSVSATDGDSRTNSQIYYSLGEIAYVLRPDSRRSAVFSSPIETIRSREVFEIDPESGDLKTTKPLDRELYSRYVLRVLASNPSESRVRSPLLTSDVNVTVDVEDLNDNTPVFNFPKRSGLSMHVGSNVEPGDSFTIVKAHDRDSAKFGQLRYSILSGNDNALFNLDEDTGKMSLSRLPRRPVELSASLTLVAYDSGSPPLQGLTTLSIVFNSSAADTSASRKGSFLAGGSADLHQHVVIIVIGAAGFVILVLLFVVISAIKCRAARPADRSSYKSIYPVDLAVPPPGAPLDFAKTALPPPPPEPRRANGRTACSTLTRRPPSSSNGHRRKEVTFSQATLEMDETGVLQRPAFLSEREIQVHQVPDVLRRPDADAESAGSAETSNADSGHGASEEGNGNSRRPAATSALDLRDHVCAVPRLQGSSGFETVRYEGSPSRRKTPATPEAVPLTWTPQAKPTPQPPKPPKPLNSTFHPNTSPCHLMEPPSSSSLLDVDSVHSAAAAAAAARVAPYLTDHVLEFHVGDLDNVKDTVV